MAVPRIKDGEISLVSRAGGSRRLLDVVGLQELVYTSWPATRHAGLLPVSLRERFLPLLGAPVRMV